VTLVVLYSALGIVVALCWSKLGQWHPRTDTIRCVIAVLVLPSSLSLLPSASVSTLSPSSQSSSSFFVVVVCHGRALNLVNCPRPVHPMPHLFLKLVC
jgi:hypothetical protein